MRSCYFCHKPLPIARRHSIFCSLRCEQLYAALQEREQGQAAPPPVQPPPAGGAASASQPHPPHPHR